MIKTLIGKAKTARRLLIRGELIELAKTLCSHVVRYFCYRIDYIDVRKFKPIPVDGAADYEFEKASKEKMSRLFSKWPDSEEELLRHRQVHEEYGFKNCFVLVERKTGRFACIQFLLTFNDVMKGKKHLPWRMYKPFTSIGTAWQQWIYVFGDFRRIGLSIEATNRMVLHCQETGIERLYSSRSITNHPSVQMANRVGFQPIARAHHFQFFKQARAKGLHLVRYTKK